MVSDWSLGYPLPRKYLKRLLGYLLLREKIKVESLGLVVCLKIFLKVVWLFWRSFCPLFFKVKMMKLIRLSVAQKKSFQEL